jgi:hypothetical protein
MNAARKLEQMLHQHNFKPVRHNSHRVFKNHEGKIFVTALTPSDYRWAHNAVTQLKRVISNPVQPMILAISDFEREQATEKIAGQQKHQIGQSNGKSKHSKGTGFIYEDRNVLTEEDKLQRETQRKQAQENAQRRRDKKLAQRAAAEEKRQREDAEFEKTFGEFLKVAEANANLGINIVCSICEAAIENKAWYAETFYEFSQDRATMVIEHDAHNMLLNVTERLSIEENFTATNYEDVLRILNRGQERLTVASRDFLARNGVDGEMRKATVESVIHTVRRTLKRTPSIFNLGEVFTDDAKKRYVKAADFNALSHAFALSGVAAVVVQIKDAANKIRSEQVERVS